MKFIIVVALGVVCFGCSHRQAPVIEPPMSITELQKEIDPSFRLKPVKTKSSDNGWASVIEATGFMPSDTEFRDSYDSPSRKADSRPDSAAGLLSQSSELSTKVYVKQAKRTLLLYKRSLRALDRALAKPVWDPIAYQAELGIGPDAPPPDISPVFKPIRELARAKTAQAIAELYEGDLAGAVASFQQVRKIADRLDQMHYGYMCVMISDSVQRIAVQYAVLSLSDSHWNPNDLTKLMAVFDDRRTDDLLRDTAKFELAYLFIPVVYQLPANMNLGPSMSSNELLVKKLLEDHQHPLDRKKTIKDASLLSRDEVERSIRSKGTDNNEVTRLALLGAKWPQQVFNSEPMSEDDIVKGRAELRSETNPLGKYLTAKVLLAPTYLAKDIYATESLVRMAQIDIAIEVYRRRFKREPRTLADLIKTRCTCTLPQDPFSGKPFGYSPGMKLLWSVGPNKIDDGGNMGDGIAYMNSSRRDLVLPTDARKWLARMRSFYKNKPQLPPYLK